jgi:uncharacterized protein (TIGR02996 family)
MKPALLAAIRAAPEDDLPRLAYADWLEESGDAPAALRAEFIRVQIELARVGEDDLRYPELRRREAELLEDHKDEWVRAEMPPGIAVSEGGFGRGFQRGFAAEPWCPASAFLEYGADLARLPVETLRLVQLPAERVADLAASPALAHFPRLDLSSNAQRIGTTELATLLASPHLPELTALTLGREQLGLTGGQLLADCDRLRRLTDLCLGACRHAALDLHPLLHSPHLRNVVRWDLTANDLDDRAATLLGQHEAAWEWKALHLGLSRFSQAGLRSVLGNPYLHNLETLSLPCLVGSSGRLTAEALVAEITQTGLPPSLRRLHLAANHLRPEDAAALARAEDLAGLTELGLSDNAVGGAAAALAASPHLAELTSLSLYQGHLDAPAIEALATSPYLRLRRVSLSENRFGPAGMRALAESPVLGGIVELNLSECEILEEGARALAAAAWLGRLHKLDLDRNRVTDGGAVALAGSAAIAGLLRLGLRGNGLTDRGALALADSPYCARLRRLDLSSNLIGDEGALALARSPHLHPLLHLNVAGARISPATEAALRERFGARLFYQR